MTLEAHEAEKHVRNFVKTIKANLETETSIKSICVDLATVIIGNCCKELNHYDITITEEMKTLSREYSMKDLTLLLATELEIRRMLTYTKGWHDFMSYTLEVEKELKESKGQFMTPRDIIKFSNAIRESFERKTNRELLRFHEPTCGTGMSTVESLDKYQSDGVIHKTKVAINDIDMQMVKIATAQILLFNEVRNADIKELIVTKGDTLVGNEKEVFRAKRKY